ncbi:MAG: hypothetical protein GEU26_04045 [Nitrososphaeraceae archaeon]|nr:hypothetical protein [Nitrososphaeraceae archaeon]
MDKVLGVPVISLDIKTDVERFRISNAPLGKVVLLDGGSLSVDNVSIERVELRLYRERFDKGKGFYSLITVYLKSSKGEIELKFDEGFKGSDPLQEISMILMRYVGLESIINRTLIAFRET